MTFTDEARQHFEDVIRRARQDGVPEHLIQYAVDAEVENGLDVFSEFSLRGRLAHFTQGGHGPRPPEGESPTRPRVSPPHEW